MSLEGDAEDSVSDIISSRPQHIYQSKSKQRASSSDESVLDTGWRTSRVLNYYDGEVDGGRVTLTGEELTMKPESISVGSGLLRQARFGLREQKRQCVVA